MERPRRSSSSLPKTANSITASPVIISSNGTVQERKSTSHPSSPTTATSKPRKSGSPLILLKSQTSPPPALKSSSSAASLTLDPALAVVAAASASGPTAVANSAETGQAATTPTNNENSLTTHHSGQSDHPSPSISASASLPHTSASRAEGELPDADGGNASNAILQSSSLDAASLDEALPRPSSPHAMATNTTITTPSATAAAPSVAADGKSGHTPAGNQTIHQDDGDSATAAGPARKGGHSLRKRARVDYTFEHIDDAPTVPNSTSIPSASHRSYKKRKSHADDFNDHHHSAKRRISSAGVESSPTSSRRRNPARKTSEVHSYREPIEEDQIPVLDTIEVGGVAYNEEPQVDEAEYQEFEPQPMDVMRHPEQPVLGDPPAQDYSQYYVQSSSDQVPWLQHETAADSYQMPASSLDPDKAADYPEDPESQLQQEIYGAQNARVAIEASPQPIDPMLSAEYSSQTGVRSSPLMDGDSQGKPAATTACEADPTQDVGSTLQSAPLDQQVAAERASPEPSEHSAAPVAEATIIEARVPQDEVNDDYPESPLKSNTQIQEADHAALVESEQTEENGDLVGKESPAVQNESTPDTSLSQTAESQVAKGSTEAEESIELDHDQDTQLDQAFLEDSTEAIDQDRNDYANYPYVRKLAKSFPAPTGRWAHLTPYVQDRYISLPEREDTMEANDASEQPSEDKDSDEKYDIDAEALVEDNEDAAQAPTPLPMTPRAGTPVQGSNEATNLNSPAPGMDEKDDGAGSESQEDPESDNYWKFRKVRDAQDFYDAFENWEQLSRDELVELCESAAVSMRAWREEYECLRSIVEDEENAQRRRAYEAKPSGKPFAMKGHHADIREPYTELRYLQDQDRRMAAAYAFEHDPHVTKVGKQDPLAQRAGIATRGRALRSQPKQTAKATETEEVTGKRPRKPVQLFDGSQDVSRATTPVPGRGRRRRAQNADSEASVPPAPASVGNDDNSGAETGPGRRRRRAPRSQVVATATENTTPFPTAESLVVPDMQSTKPRRHRKPTLKADEGDEPAVNVAEQTVVRESTPEKRRLVTLKLSRGGLSKVQLFPDLTSTATDPQEDRPSTSCSEASGNTIGSAYGFRPKRQKRFRDEPEEDTEMLPEQPPRKRARKTQGSASANNQRINSAVEDVRLQHFPRDPPKPEKRTTKIKVVRSTHAPPAMAPSESRTGTPLSIPNSTEDGDDKKEYSAMTKSEKMSASMKSRWANGNMAGAVEKRKATLAAKKAAQVAAEQKVGPLAPKPKKAGKKETASQEKSTPRSTPSATPQPTPQQQPHSTMQNYTNPAPPEIPPQYQHSVPQQPMSFHAQPVLHQHGHPMPAHGHHGFMQNQQPPPPQGPQQPQPAQQSRAASFMHGLPGMGLFYPTK